MPNTPRMKWPYPSEDQDPWHDAFRGMAEALDASGAAAREDRNLIMGGGGVVSFNSTTGELSWDANFEIFSSEIGFLFSIPIGSVNLQDGELFYADIVRNPISSSSVNPLVSSQVPQSDDAYAIGIRRGDDVYFRFGAKIGNGEAFNIFQGGGGGGASAGDTYERSSTFSIPDGSSTAVSATLGRTLYAGSIIGLSTEITEPVVAGSIEIKIQRNGLDTLVTTLDSGTPSNSLSTAVVGTWVTTPSDAITVVVTPTGYDNISGLDGGLTVNVALTTGLTLGPTDIPDASLITKGISRVSVAPISPTDPVSVGDNDPRVDGFSKTGSNVVIQTNTDLVNVGSISLDQNPSSNNYLEADSGSAAAVSAPNKGRLRYDVGTQKWQFSENGAAYQDFGAGVGGSNGWERVATVVQLETPADTVRVGTGTNSPVFPGKVTITDDVNPALTVKLGAESGAEASVFASSTSAGLGSNSNHPLSFYTNFQNQWEIGTDGNIVADRNLQAIHTGVFDFSVEPGGAGTNGNYLAGGAGSAAAVSAASSGRLRYNEGTQKWQVSENGGAYIDIGSGSSGGSYVSTSSFGLSTGASSQEATLGRVTFSGSLIGLGVHVEDATTTGTVTVNVKVGGITKLTGILNSGSNTEHVFDTAAIATHAIASPDEITVEVVADGSYDNAASGVTGLVATVTMTDATTAAEPNVALLNASQVYTAGQSVAQVALVDGSGIIVDGALSNNFQLELTQNSDLTDPTNVVEGQIIRLAIRQDVTGGKTLAYGSSFKFPGGAPTITTGADSEDLITCYVREVSAGTAITMLCSIAQDHN